MWEYYNPNPVRTSPTGDCTVRAISKALDISWDEAHDLTCWYSKRMGLIQHYNVVVAAILRDNGFVKAVAPSFCPVCYTVKDFCMDHPHGVYVLGTGSHFVCSIDGDYYDSWDSGEEIIEFYFYLQGE